MNDRPHVNKCSGGESGKGLRGATVEFPQSIMQ